MLKIILDTNFLLVPAKFKVDVFEEMERVVDQKFKLVVPESIREELERLAGGKSEDSKAARTGLKLLERENVEFAKTKNKGDEAIIELADENTIVATMDKDLKKRLKNKGIGIIYLRGKSHLSME